MRQFKNIITGKVAYEDTSHKFYNYEGSILKKEQVENNNNWEEITEEEYFYAKAKSNPYPIYVTSNKIYFCKKIGETYYWYNDKENWDFYSKIERFNNNFTKIESDYTILSFKCNQGISRLISNGRYLYERYDESDLPLSKVKNDGNGATLMDMVNIMNNDSSYKIHSIKRNSDGVIFTIGDYIKHESSSKDKGKIYEISFPPHMNNLTYENDIFDKLIIKYGSKSESPYNGFWNGISVLHHFKEFDLKYDELINGKYYTTHYEGQGYYTFKQGYDLWYYHDDMKIQCCDGDFTYKNGFKEFRIATKYEISHLESFLGFTEDNEPIILGNGYFVISKEYNYSKAYYFINNKNIYYLPEKNWYFKSEEKANEFIINNKPCLSIKDINIYISFPETIKKLEKIVKSRL